MKSFAEFLNEAKATYCGRCGTTHVPPSQGGTCPALKKEAYDAYGYHTSVNKGTFQSSKHGEKGRTYLHDTEHKSGDGEGHQLVTFDKQSHANKAAKQHGGKVEKTQLGTYRVYKEEVEQIDEANIVTVTGSRDIRPGTKHTHVVVKDHGIHNHETGAQHRVFTVKRPNGFHGVLVTDKDKSHVVGQTHGNHSKEDALKIADHYVKHGQVGMSKHAPWYIGGDKIVKEDVEQIDEISKEKTQKYLDRAMGDHDHQNMARRNTTGDAQKEYARKEALRKKGISRAVDRLYPKNEEVDFIHDMTEGLRFNDKKGKWEWDDGTRVEPDELTPAQKQRVQQWKAANPGKRSSKSNVPDTREPVRGFGGRVYKEEADLDEGRFGDALRKTPAQKKKELDQYRAHNELIKKIKSGEVAAPASTKPAGYTAARHADRVVASQMREESEQLDEISDKTLQSYRSKAHTQIQHYKYAGGKEKPEAGEVLAKREPGMKRATDKVIKKDAEARAAAPKRPPAQHKDKYPLGGRDEISGRSYSEEVELDEDFTKMDTSTLKKWITTRERNSMAANLSKKRSDQYDQATAELKRRREVKEGVEQVDELNQMTLSRYAAAAKSDVAKQAHIAGTTDSVDDAKKAFDKAKKRQAGISTANRRMRFGEYSEMVDSQSENNK